LARKARRRAKTGLYVNLSFSETGKRKIQRSSHVSTKERLQCHNDRHPPQISTRRQIEDEREKRGLSSGVRRRNCTGETRTQRRTKRKGKGSGKGAQG